MRFCACDRCGKNRGQSVSDGLFLCPSIPLPEEEMGLEVSAEFSEFGMREKVKWLRSQGRTGPRRIQLLPAAGDQEIDEDRPSEDGGYDADREFGGSQEFPCQGVTQGQNGPPEEKRACEDDALVVA